MSIYEFPENFENLVSLYKTTLKETTDSTQRVTHFGDKSKNISLIAVLGSRSLLVTSQPYTNIPNGRFVSARQTLKLSDTSEEKNLERWVDMGLNSRQHGISVPMFQQYCIANKINVDLVNNANTIKQMLVSNRDPAMVVRNDRITLISNFGNFKAYLHLLISGN